MPTARGVVPIAPANAAGASAHPAGMGAQFAQVVNCEPPACLSLRPGEGVSVRTSVTGYTKVVLDALSRSLDSAQYTHHNSEVSGLRLHG